MSLKGRTALVTGSARGIGKAIALRLAADGADVIINDRNGSQAALDTVEECKALGVSAYLVKGDVSDEASVDAMFEQIMELTGRVDILVNNAGITKDNLMLRMSPADFDAVIDINLKGAFYCSKKASRIMLKQKYGRIINISSVVGVRGNVGQVNYAASKAGLIGMTKSLAKELAAKGITVNAIAPGMIETDMTNAMSDQAHEAMEKTIPAGHMGKATDIANAASFFSEEEASYITGQVLCVDGGMAV